MFKENRICKIKITRELIEDSPDFVFDAFTKLKLLTLHVDHDYGRPDSIREYFCYSENLPILPEGCMAPQYQIQITTHNGGRKEYKLIEAEKERYLICGVFGNESIEDEVKSQANSDSKKLPRFF